MMTTRFADDETIKHMAQQDAEIMRLTNELEAVKKERDKLLGHREALLIDLGASLTREEKYPCYPSGICKADAIEADLTICQQQRDELVEALCKIHLATQNQSTTMRGIRKEVCDALALAKLGTDKTGEVG